jgi:hypothetical protein
VGNGESINIWEDNWIVGQNGYKVLTPHHNQNNFTKVSELMLAQPTKNWNSSLINQLFLPFESTLIQQTPLLVEDIADQLMWPHTKDGYYTVKSGYNLLKLWHDADSTGTTSNAQGVIWKKLWNLHTIPRHKALLWRIIQNAIPVKSALSKGGIPCNTLCPRCFSKEETVDHTFMKCEHAAKIWFGSKLSINFNNTPASFIDWTSYAITTLKEEELIYIAAITYGIWYARNQQVFEHREIPDIEVINKAATNIQDFVLATKNANLNYPNNNQHSANFRQHGSHRNQSKRWSRPEEGKIKINGDVNLTIAGKCGLGVTCRDMDGLIAAAAAWEVQGNDDPLLAEAYALYHAVCFAAECCFQEVIFESDNANIINIINSADRNPRSDYGMASAPVCLE